MGSASEKGGASQEKFEIWREVPGHDEVQWENTPLGAPENWSATLKTASALILNLPYPSALFWTEDFALLCNRSWYQLRENVDQQGQSQASRLKKPAQDAIRDVLNEKKFCSLDSGAVFENGPKQFHILCSPIIDVDNGRVDGVLAQLLPHIDSDSARTAIEQAIGARPESPPRDQGAASDSDQHPISNVEIQDDINKKLRGDRGADGQEPKRYRSHLQQGALDDMPIEEHPFFRRFAAMLPTGLAILNHKAEAVFVNKHFYELTTHKDGDKSFNAWPHTIHGEDYHRVMQAYQEAFDKQKSLRMEFRTQGNHDSWRLLLLTPLGDDNLRHISLREYGGFICAIVDITQNKLAELQQKIAAEEARERKEQQERFIDMISHEIRNPLSAILHCAEDILDVTKTFKKGDVKDTIVEATDTITLCVAHQQNIVDDILSYSKLDASMLSLTPRDVRPKAQLAESLKMFQPQMRKKSIGFDFKIDVSYRDLEVDWVKADLVRISQVIVNLITNAIKFTAKKVGKKEVTVAIGASIERPTSYPPNVVFFDTDDGGFRMDGTLNSEWGNGQPMYIMVAVIDTGIGIGVEDQKKLFERFRQATPKTAEVYGGSGLGLNISRKICHLHGGDVGVKSVEGEGSTFGFFFKVRKSAGGDAEEMGNREDAEAHDIERIKKRAAAMSDKARETVDDEDIPDSLANPEYTHVKEVRATGGSDSKYENTEAVASQVEDESRSGAQSRNASRHQSRTRSRRSSTTQHGDSNKGVLNSTDPEALKTEHESHDSRSKSQGMLSTASQNKTVEHEDKVRILLVEDNVINARILKRKLENKGFLVHTAVNGREGVDAVQGNRNSASSSDKGKSTDDEVTKTSQNGKRPHTFYDAILMDQEMPIMDGNAAARAIRAWEADLEEKEVDDNQTGRDRFHVPILGVSANVRKEHQDKMKEAGIDDFLGKPYAIGDIVKKIGTLTGREPGEGEDGVARKKASDVEESNKRKESMENVVENRIQEEKEKLGKESGKVEYVESESKA